MTCHHLLFDRHRIVLAEDCPTESVFPGPATMAAIDADARAELLDLFHELAGSSTACGPTARMVLRRPEAPALRQRIRSGVPLRPHRHIAAPPLPPRQGSAAALMRPRQGSAAALMRPRQGSALALMRPRQGSALALLKHRPACRTAAALELCRRAL